jgi:molecular chaperone Hsp33
MLRNLGREEVESILTEQAQIDVGCEFCGEHYRFDAVDAAELFTETTDHPPGSTSLQ